MPCKRETGVRFPAVPNTFLPEGLASHVIRLLEGQTVKVSGMSVEIFAFFHIQGFTLSSSLPYSIQILIWDDIFPILKY